VITTTVNTKGLDAMRTFCAQASNQLPFAASLALNQTARDVQLALKAQVSESFTSPTPFTRNAFIYTKSTKANLTAQVTRRPDRHYLDIQTFGGTRRWKAYEGLLRGLAKGQGTPLPSGKLLPTSTALNAAGNPKRSLFPLIQSKLSSNDPGGFFIGKPRHSDAPPGVYRRSRGRLHAYFTVADSEPAYRPRFPFERVGNQAVARNFPSHLARAVERAMKSAR